MSSNNRTRDICRILEYLIVTWLFGFLLVNIWPMVEMSKDTKVEIVLLSPILWLFYVCVEFGFWMTELTHWLAKGM